MLFSHFWNVLTLFAAQTAAAETAAPETKTVFRFARIEDNSDWIIPGLVVSLLVFWMVRRYRKDAAELNFFGRWFLVALRLLLVFGLLFVFLQPQWENYAERSRVAVLIDTSASMSQKDEIKSKTDSSASDSVDVSANIADTNSNSISSNGVNSNDSGSDSANISALNSWKDVNSGKNISPERLEQVKDWLKSSEMIKKLREKHDVVIYAVDRNLTRLQTFKRFGSPEDSNDLSENALSADNGAQKTSESGTAAQRSENSADNKNSGTENLDSATAQTTNANSTNQPDQLAQSNQLNQSNQSNETAQTVSNDKKNNAENSVSDNPDDLIQSLSAQGEETRLGDALEDLFRREKGQPLSGVILISDGGSNAGTLPEIALRRSNIESVPIYTVGIGTTERPRNFRVLNLDSPERAFPTDPFMVTADVELTGFDPRDRQNFGIFSSSNTSSNSGSGNRNSSDSTNNSDDSSAEDSDSSSSTDSNTSSAENAGENLSENSNNSNNSKNTSENSVDSSTDDNSVQEWSIPIELWMVPVIHDKKIVNSADENAKENVDLPDPAEQKTDSEGNPVPAANSNAADQNQNNSDSANSNANTADSNANAPNQNNSANVKTSKNSEEAEIQAFEAELQNENIPGGMKIAEETLHFSTLSLDNENQWSIRESMNFEVPPTEIGSYRIVARIKAPEDDETFQDNHFWNELEIVDRKDKVLLISGGPNRDFQFLKSQIARDKTMTLHLYLPWGMEGIAQDGDKLLDAFPATAAELAEYDSIVAFDVDWKNSLTLEQIDLLENWVARQGGGLIVTAGPVYMGEQQGGWADDADYDKIRALYPVELFARSSSFDHQFVSDAQPWTLAWTSAGKNADFLRLSDDEAESEQGWKEFPGVYSCLQVKGVKPAATLLAKMSNPMLSSKGIPVYFAEQFYGSGRVFYLGSSEIWRLRKNNESYFEHFYTKLLRHVAQGRLARTSDYGVLTSDRTQYALGGTANIRAVVNDSALKPLELPDVPVEMTFPDGKTKTLILQKDPNLAGSYFAQTPVASEGIWKLSLAVPGCDEVLKAEFDVQISNLERENPLRNELILTQLAQDSGGIYYPQMELACSVNGNPLSKTSVNPSASGLAGSSTSSDNLNNSNNLDNTNNSSNSGNVNSTLSTVDNKQNNLNEQNNQAKEIKPITELLTIHSFEPVIDVQADKNWAMRLVWLLCLLPMVEWTVRRLMRLA